MTGSTFGVGYEQASAGRARARRRWSAGVGAAALVVAGLAAPQVAEAAPVSASAAPAPTPKKTPAKPKTPPAKTPAKTAPWTAAQYAAQKPVWSADLCSAATKRPAQVVATMSPGSKVVCARVRTPYDWRNLSRGSTTLQLTKVTRRVVKGDKRPTRVLFVNPGGPGVAADWLAPSAVALEPALGASHEVVAMDPRGTGGSMPTACPAVNDGIRDRRKPTAATIARAQKAVAAWVASCVRSTGGRLGVISTQQTIRDQDLARTLLKANTIDYYGVSAGTWLGARYAEAYPTRVGRVVLDSNLEFSAPWRTAFAWQPKGFQRRFDAQFLPWAARGNADWHLGTTTAQVRATYEAIRARVAAGKVRGLTADDLDDDVIDAMYRDTAFPELAQQLSDLRARTGVRVGRAAAASTPVGGSRAADTPAQTTVFNAVTCNDSAWSKSPASYVAEGLAMGRLYPVIGYEWVTSPCATWPYAPQLAPAAKGHPTMVMVQNELDPATPLEGARRAHAATPNTRMISVDDDGGHGAYLGDNPCVERAVTAYLVAGTLPPVDSVCSGQPLPNEGRVYPVGTKLAGRSPLAGPHAPATRGGAQQQVRRTAQDRVADSTRTTR